MQCATNEEGFLPPGSAVSGSGFSNYLHSWFPWNISQIARRGMKVILLVLFPGIAFQNAAADDLLVQAYPRKCMHGLHDQPDGGPFTVFLFCDDALGSNIGVINSKSGAGPGAIRLAGSKIWENWDVNNRFWQDPEWATDVTSFAWSPDLRFLYVATSEIYGTGNLYKLDLVSRTYTKLLSKEDAQLGTKDAFQSEITAIDKATGELSVQCTIYRSADKKSEVINKKIKQLQD